MKAHKFIFAICIWSCFFTLRGFGWGERGHHVICAVATRLVSNSELSSFLKGRGHQSGHVCNIPDIHWKDHSENNQHLDSSHFMDPENLSYQISEVPTDLSQIAKDKGKSLEQLSTELGTLWWRADQFFRIAKSSVQSAKDSEFPEKSHVKNIDHYHNTYDYDGWEKGRGGIHAYYESFSVDALGMDLENLVFENALEVKRQTDSAIAKKSVIQIMKQLSVQAVNELPEVESLDPMTEPSEKNSKSYAKRPSADKGAKAFKKLIIPQMARSSWALAQLWEKAWNEGGSVSFKAYRSYRYPLAPEIVPLDYLGK
ncbi:MAG: hypothetical protein EBR01_01410 [Proteobacteria bacterium]|nr:hypothetical protein [Pseudomonadota bacterium]